MKTVLIVDDISDNLYLLESLLKSKYKVLTAINGSEALALALENPPDIIVSDILMPVMDGYTLINKWKNEPSLQEIPFIFYTATYTTHQDKQLALNLGADAFLLKPIDIEDFLIILENTIQKKIKNPIEIKATNDLFDEVVLTEYNQVLIHKLEDKMHQTEDALRKLDVYSNRLEIELEEKNKKTEEIELLHQIINDSKTVAFLWKLDANWTIDFVTDNVDIIFGYTKKEFIDQNINYKNLIFPGDLYQVETTTSKNLKENSKETFLYDFYRIIRKDGVIEWVVQRSNFRRNNKGVITHLQGVIEDVTEVVKKENSLKIALEKAHESDRLKSAFLANLSHEIRTPMSGILGFSELLRNPELSIERQQKYIDIITKSSNRLLNTITDIVEISKIDSGTLELSISEINLNNQVDLLLNFYEDFASKKEITLESKNTLTDVEATVLTDYAKMFGIMSNLVNNAIKFTKNGGKVIIGLNDLGDTLQFFVKDNGIGIPKDRLPYIFDRFVQADIEDKEVHEGLGLGLAIVKSYVTLLGGKIGVESKEGKGSLFYVTFPKNIEKQEEITETITVNDKIQNELNFLIVEDDPSASEFIGEFVKPLSNKTYFAASGKEAISIFVENKDINMILLDIKLPDFNGYEVARQIRAFNTSIIIIAITAYAMPFDKQKAIEAGCTDYLTKPVTKNELLKIIQKNV